MSSIAFGAHDCLLIIDVQNDFCAGGPLEVPDADSILPVINALGKQCSNIVLTQDWHPANHSSFVSQHPGKQAFESIDMPYGEQTLWPEHCVQGTKGAEFHPELDTDQARAVVRKGFRSGIDSYSAFFENDKKTSLGLASYLRELEVKRIICVGLALDYCVQYSAIDARNQGFDVCVVEAGCRGIDLQGSNAAARQKMQDAGISLV